MKTKYKRSQVTLYRPELALNLPLHANFLLRLIRHVSPLRRPAKSQNTLTNHHRPLSLSTDNTAELQLFWEGNIYLR